VEREGLELLLVVIGGLGLVNMVFMLWLWSTDESDGGGDMPRTGSMGGGRLSVGVASKRLLEPDGTVLSDKQGRISGVGDMFWGSKGGGSKLSSVWGDKLSTVTGFFGSLIV